MIFSYCTSSERREIAFVCKEWDENLQSFAKDYELILNDCYLRDDIEPVSLLMKSSRKYRYLVLGSDATSESPEITKRLLSHLGQHVEVLDISCDHKMKLLDDPDSLLLFPHVKQLRIKELARITQFDKFPKTLEELNVEELSDVEHTNVVDHLRKIKKLKKWTADIVKLTKAAAEMAPKLDESITITLTLDDSLKDVLKEILDLEKLSVGGTINLLGNSLMKIEDITEIRSSNDPKTFTRFGEFPNLISIHISWDENSYTSCFNYHDVVLCPKVWELVMDGVNNRTCMACFRTLSESFPKLQKLNLLKTELRNEHFKYICFKLPQLKFLGFDSSWVSEFFKY